MYGYDLSVAADTVSNVLAVNAMRRVAQLASVAGDAAADQTWQTRAAHLAASINAVLRRPDGTYVDGVDQDGAPSGHASQEANALALAYDVVPASDLAAVGAYVAGLGIAVGPNHGLELLRGLAAAGMPEAMVHTAHRHVRPGLGPHCGGRWHLHLGGLAAERPDRGLHVTRLGFLGAGGHAGDAPGGPAPGSPKRTAPSGSFVAPPSAGLARARGSVPTIAGPVLVSWQRRGNGHGHGTHGAGERVGDGAPARRHTVERP